MNRERNTKTNKRMHWFEHVFGEVKDKVRGSGQDEHLHLNGIILFNAIESYFDDVERHKAYHGSALVDKVKQAAYTIKWIAKLRPIYFDVDLLHPNRTVMYANEIFALRCGFLLLGVKTSTLPIKVYKEALYTLRYRSVDERYLMLWLTHLVS